MEKEAMVLEVGSFPILADIQSQSEAFRPRLIAALHTLPKILPNATMKISWKIPTFWQGKNRIHFAVAKHPLGIYPGSVSIPHAREGLKQEG